MQIRLTRFVALTSMLLAAVPASAAPVTLKLAFFTSDRSNIYQCQIKPFVEAVNNAGFDRVRIDVTFERRPGFALSNLPKLLLDGETDITAILPADAPDRFPERIVLQLPGLFRDQEEATRVYARLIEANTFAEYRDFVILGAFNSAGETIHSRKPINNLSELRGQTIRTNNEMQATTLARLGARPVLLPINQTMDQLGQGAIDGATVPLAMLFDFGFGRLTAHHYLLQLGSVPAILAMQSAKFEKLPAEVQEILRRHGVSWLSERTAACMESRALANLTQMHADTRRKVVSPSPANQIEARRIFSAIADEWAAQSPRNRELLDLVKAEIVKVRAGK